MALSSRWRWLAVLSAVLGAVLGLALGAGVVDALVLSAIAGIGLTLTLGSVGRRVVGVLVGFLGGLVAAAPWWDRASTGSGYQPAGVVAAGALLLTAGVLTVLTAADRTSTSRFERDPEAASLDTSADQHPIDQWRALDRGDDPTR